MPVGLILACAAIKWEHYIPENSWRISWAKIWAGKRGEGAEGEGSEGPAGWLILDAGSGNGVYLSSVLIQGRVRADCNTWAKQTKIDHLFLTIPTCDSIGNHLIGRREYQYPDHCLRLSLQTERYFTHFSRQWASNRPTQPATNCRYSSEEELRCISLKILLRKAYLRKGSRREEQLSSNFLRVRQLATLVCEVKIMNKRPMRDSLASLPLVFFQRLATIILSNFQAIAPTSISSQISTNFSSMYSMLQEFRLVSTNSRITSIHSPVATSLCEKMRFSCSMSQGEVGWISRLSTILTGLWRIRAACFSRRIQRDKSRRLMVSRERDFSSLHLEQNLGRSSYGSLRIRWNQASNDFQKRLSWGWNWSAGRVYDISTKSLMNCIRQATWWLAGRFSIINLKYLPLRTMYSSTVRLLSSMNTRFTSSSSPTSCLGTNAANLKNREQIVAGDWQPILKQTRLLSSSGVQMMWLLMAKMRLTQRQKLHSSQLWGQFLLTILQTKAKDILDYSLYFQQSYRDCDLYTALKKQRKYWLLRGSFLQISMRVRISSVLCSLTVQKCSQSWLNQGNSYFYTVWVLETTWSSRKEMAWKMAKLSDLRFCSMPREARTMMVRLTPSKGSLLTTLWRVRESSAQETQQSYCSFLVTSK